MKPWLAVLALALMPTLAPATGRAWIELGEQRLAVELAETADEKARGLMHRKQPPTDGGMLFIYQPPRSIGFWMKNMRFPLDILFFDRHGRLAAYHDAVPPCASANCPRYRSDRPSAWVLELPAGTRQRMGLKPGAQLRWLGREGGETGTGGDLTRQNPP
jgi:uncharacterized membrane protein (UPF0127 family)